MRSAQFIFACVVVSFLSCGEAAKVSEIKLAHGLSEDHAVHKGMVDFARRVREKSFKPSFQGLGLIYCDK